jgi:hypothetical protein
MMNTTALRNTTIRFVCFLLAFLFSFSVYARQGDSSKGPYARIETPEMQAGIPESEFQLPIRIIDVVKETSVEIRFERGPNLSSEGLTEPKMNPVSFTTDKDTTVFAKPVFVDDGLFIMFAYITINGVERQHDLLLLKIEDRIYYGGSYGGMFASMVDYDLRDDKTYQNLREKSKRHYSNLEALQEEARKKERSSRRKTLYVLNSVRKMKSSIKKCEKKRPIRYTGESILGTPPKKKAAKK